MLHDLTVQLSVSYFYP